MCQKLQKCEQSRIGWQANSSVWDRWSLGHIKEWVQNIFHEELRMWIAKCLPNFLDTVAN